MPAGPAPGRSRGHPGGRHRRRGRLPGARRRRPAATSPAPAGPSSWRRSACRGSATWPCTGSGCRTPASTAAAPSCARPCDRCSPAPTPTSRRGPATRTRTTAPPGSPPRTPRRVTAHGWAYPVWMWAWLTPDDPAVPWDRARLLRLDAAARDRQARRDRRLHLPGRPRPGRLATRARRRHARARRTARGAAVPHRPLDVGARVAVHRALRGRRGPVAGRLLVRAAQARRRAGEPAPRALPAGLRARLRDGRAHPRARRALRRGAGLGPGGRSGPPGPRTHGGRRRRPGRAGRPARRRAGGAGRPRDLQRGPLLPRRRHRVGHARPHPRGPRARRGRRRWCTGASWPAEAPRDAAATHRMLRARPELTPVVEHVDDGFVLLVLRRR